MEWIVVKSVDIVFNWPSIIIYFYRQEKNIANANGIPDFWLTIFKNVGILSEMVQEHDEPILKHLIDVKVILLKSEPMVSLFIYVRIKTFKPILFGILREDTKYNED